MRVKPVDTKPEPMRGALAILPELAKLAALGELNEPTREQRADGGQYVETDGGDYQIVNGVAIVPIIGAIAQYGSWYRCGHEALTTCIVDALSNIMVGSVILEINSPGGIVAGGFDAIKYVRDVARQSGKRVFAFASERAYSMGYAWACVADEIHLPESGGVGSVGVLGVIESWDRFNKESGFDIAVIRSGAQKADGHPDLPLDPAAVAREQIEVDRLAAIFAGIVSESRGLTVEDILAKQGATIHGPEAVAAGFADSVTTFAAVLAMAETASREYRMQSIATRLGLAANATEQQINDELTKREVAAAAALDGAKKEAAEATAKADILAGCAADLAVRCGVITTGLRESRKTYLIAAPAAAASELATAAPMLPAMRDASSEGTKSGTDYKSQKEEELTEFPTDTGEQLALYKRNPELYHKLRNARKGS